VVDAGWMEPTRVGDLLAAGRVVTMSSIMGELVTETLEFDGGRKVTAYVPAGAPQAVVFAGDGQLIRSGADSWKRRICRRR